MDPQSKHKISTYLSRKEEIKRNIECRYKNNIEISQRLEQNNAFLQRKRAKISKKMIV